jgi:UDP-N-acetylglucosamine--N-acetylmuramyl-(pentapeptide) pyrophosphoryl-undecaprenol N-acetylglucosamine transferase
LELASVKRLSVFQLDKDIQKHGRTEMSQKEIWIACGGTVGHFMPVVVLGKSLEQRGFMVRYWGEGKAIEKNLCDAQKVSLNRPNSGSRWKRLKQLWSMLSKQAKHQRPVACLCCGGFSSFAIGSWALLNRIPYHLFEQNAIPGRVNRFLAPFSSSCHLTFPLQKTRLRAAQIDHSGNPVRKIEHNPEDKVRDLLILGGSQGAKSLNCELPKLLEGFLRVTHVCGPNRKVECEQAWQESKVDGEVEILESHHDIPSLLAGSRWTISRAGATSICEMVGANVACIVVPYPYAKDDHQRANARYLESQQAAHVLEEAEFSTKKDWLNKILVDDEAREESVRGLQKAGLEDRQGLKAIDLILKA